MLKLFHTEKGEKIQLNVEQISSTKVQRCGVVLVTMYNKDKHLICAKSCECFNELFEEEDVPHEEEKPEIPFTPSPEAPKPEDALPADSDDIAPFVPPEKPKPEVPPAPEAENKPQPTPEPVPPAPVVNNPTPIAPPVNNPTPITPQPNA